MAHTHSQVGPESDLPLSQANSRCWRPAIGIKEISMIVNGIAHTCTIMHVGVFMYKLIQTIAFIGIAHSQYTEN